MDARACFHRLARDIIVRSRDVGPIEHLFLQRKRGGLALWMRATYRHIGTGARRFLPIVPYVRRESHDLPVSISWTNSAQAYTFLVFVCPSSPPSVVVGSAHAMEALVRANLTENSAALRRFHCSGLWLHWWVVQWRSCRQL